MKTSAVPILKIPHPHLRKIARPVPTVTPKVLALSAALTETLRQTKNPTGVGLAAPQINADWRLFATQLEGKIELFFNPVITAHSADLVFGVSAEEPDLEGCLSIPKFYGPVPRWSWVELEFDALVNKSFQRSRRRFEDFPARVVQHEHDHLDGILFIDYSIQLELPVYTADSRNDTMVMVPRAIIETLHHSTLLKE